MGNQLTVYAPAKINWLLHVGGRQSNGYHLIDTIMQRISLADCLEISLNVGSRYISLRCSDAGLPTDASNLVYLAAQRFLELQKCQYKCSIYLQKNIPHGAGLGGGSSDAAATLLALNQLVSTPLSMVKIYKIAEQLGADVPFFLAPERTIRCQGYGEILTPLSLAEPAQYLVIVVPSISVSTPLAYQMLDTERSTELFQISLIGQRELSHKRAFGGGNDFANVVSNSFNEVAVALRVLKQTEPIHSQMSGSGSACFGCYENASTCDQAREQIRNSVPANWLVESAQIVDHGFTPTT